MSDIVNAYFKSYRVPKYRQRLVAALCSCITAKTEEKTNFFLEIAEYEALEFSEKQIEAVKKDACRILKIRG